MVRTEDFLTGCWLGQLVERLVPCAETIDLNVGYSQSRPFASPFTFLVKLLFNKGHCHLKKKYLHSYEVCYSTTINSRCSLVINTLICFLCLWLVTALTLLRRCTIKSNRQFDGQSKSWKLV